MTADPDRIEVRGVGDLVLCQQYGGPDGSVWLTVRSSLPGVDDEALAELPIEAAAELSDWLAERVRRYRERP